MEKKFNEKMFLKTVGHLNTITPYLSTNPTARQFIELVTLHCGFREEDVCIYLKGLIESHFPDFIEKNYDKKDWVNLYKGSSLLYGGKLGEILNGAIGLFKDVKVFEDFYNLVTSVFQVNKDVCLGVTMINKVGWIRIVDTLVKMAEEMSVNETVSVEESVVVEDTTTCEEVKRVEEPIHEMTMSDETIHIEPTHVGLTLVETKMDEVIQSKKDRKRKVKRGYGIPVHQYKKVWVFDSLEEASEITGVSQSEILTCMGTRPNIVVETLWKYVDKERRRIAKFTYLHTYKNQNEIKQTSREVCGKTIYHNNIDLKTWSEIYKGEFVWLQVTGCETYECTGEGTHGTMTTAA